jgi:hypothetical protein
MKAKPSKPLAALAAATLAGSTLFASCEGLIRESIIQGTELYILELVATENFFIEFVDEEAS